MFRFDEGLKVYLHLAPVDFRLGINGLSILVGLAMRVSPMSSALFVFGNRRRDRIKILGWQGNGFWLFADTVAGAHASSNLYSLTETCRANGVEPYRYLAWLFKKLPLAATDDDYTALLPLNMPANIR